MDSEDSSGFGSKIFPMSTINIIGYQHQPSAGGLFFLIFCNEGPLKIPIIFVFSIVSPAFSSNCKKLGESWFTSSEKKKTKVKKG